MVENNNKIIIDKYLSMIFRHKFLLISCIFIAGTTGSLFSLLLPNLYMSNTLILVEPQKIPESYVQATVTSGVTDRLNSITKQVMSRTRLQRIIDEFNLFSTYKNRWKKAVEYFPLLKKIGWIEKKSKIRPSKEEIIALIRTKINVNVRNFGRGKTNYFSINYFGENPKTVMDVTNKLASLYIEENLKVREILVRGTTDFIEKELEIIRKQLEEKETLVTLYKIKNKGQLPAQQMANLRIMDQIQIRLQSVDESLQEALSREMLLKNRLNDVANALTKDGGNKKNTPNKKQLSPLEIELEKSITLLENMRTQFTGKHPDMKKIKKNILKIKKKIKLEKSNKKQNTDTPGKTALKKNKPQPILDPFYQTIKLDLDKAKMNIRTLKKEKINLKKQFKKLKTRVEQIPDKELELTTLTRDYEILKENYKSMLRKKLQARLSENLERKQKGEQFRILDPANYPETPFKPNRKKISLLSFMVGLIAGIAIIWLIEYLNDTFSSPEEIESFIDLPVIAVIHSMDT